MFFATALRAAAYGSLAGLGIFLFCAATGYASVFFGGIIYDRR